MKASLVIPTYNRLNILHSCLLGVLSQSLPTGQWEVIVVDDCSSDQTESYMRDLTKHTSNVKYLRNTSNLGRVATRNVGIRAAKNEIVIFLDNDNIPESNFVQEHIRYHEVWGIRHIAVVGNPRFDDRLIERTNFGRFLQHRYLGNRKRSELQRIDLENLPPHYFGGLNSSARRVDLIAVGLFDERFRYYGCEDEDLGYCLRRIGVRLVFAEEARTTHYDDVSISRYRLKYIEAGREGLRAMLAKNPEYAELTKIGFLLPIQLRRDSWNKIVVKCFLSVATCSGLGMLAEAIAKVSDRWSLTYCPLLYRFLTALWLRQGFRQKCTREGFVTY
jgi:GT2 family glycosyltransferase